MAVGEMLAALPALRAAVDEALAAAAVDDPEPSDEELAEIVEDAWHAPPMPRVFADDGLLEEPADPFDPPGASRWRRPGAERAEIRAWPTAEGWRCDRGEGIAYEDTAWDIVGALREVLRLTWAAVRAICRGFRVEAEGRAQVEADAAKRAQAEAEAEAAVKVEESTRTGRRR